MKNLKNTFIGLFTLVVAFTTQNVVAQDFGADVVSSYVWRGSDQGAGTSVQAYVNHSIGDNIEVGVWSNYSLHNGLTELDPYITANVGPVSVTATNYTYPSNDFGPFDFESGDMALTGLEISGSTQLGPVSLLAGYFLDGEDMYVEAGFNLAGLDLAVGMGDNGYNSEEDGMALVNVSIAYEKSIGSLPAFGQLVYNPEQDAMFVVFGISL